ncbi:MAG: hypothetical protein ACPHCN_14385 [Mycobacterium sp.]
MANYEGAYTRHITGALAVSVDADTDIFDVTPIIPGGRLQFTLQHSVAAQFKVHYSDGATSGTLILNEILAQASGGVYSYELPHMISTTSAGATMTYSPQMGVSGTLDYIVVNEVM